MMTHRGIFVSHAGYLIDSPGGVQQCTREYITTLRAAGIELHFCPYESDKRISTRLVKKLWPSRYFCVTEQGLIGRIKNMVEQTKSTFIFLNQAELASLAAPLRSLLLGDCKIVVLSHGLESTDLLHALRAGGNLPVGLRGYFLGAPLLGDTLLRESSYRSSLDLILCLSPLDVELERWLGARHVDWLPRTIASDPLRWDPYGNRIGFVGTLDHPPNIEGLSLFLESLSTKNSKGVQVRIAGGPDRIGRILVERFRSVEYLGALSHDALKEEASTWSCFAHPIFCSPRGCSM
jgi:hypothetical protein